MSKYLRMSVVVLSMIIAAACGDAGHDTSPPYVDPGIDLENGDVIGSQDDQRETVECDEGSVLNSYMWLYNGSGSATAGNRASDLNGIRTLQGNLTVWGKVTDEMREAFVCLRDVSGNIDIRDTDLEVIDIFPSLEKAGRGMRIYDNERLIRIGGFESLKQVDFQFYITDNPGLEIIDGFAALETVNGNFAILDNESLVEVTGFGTLKEVNLVPGFGFGNNGGIGISRNPRLEVLEMSSLERVADGIRIVDNDMLPWPNIWVGTECNDDECAANPEKCQEVCGDLEVIRSLGFPSIVNTGRGIVVVVNEE